MQASRHSFALVSAAGRPRPAAPSNNPTPGELLAVPTVLRAMDRGRKLATKVARSGVRVRVIGKTGTTAAAVDAAAGGRTGRSLAAPGAAGASAILGRSAGAVPRT